MDIKNYTRVEIINTNSCYYGEKGYVSKSIDVKGETFYLICLDSGDRNYFPKSDFTEI